MRRDTLMSVAEDHYYWSNDELSYAIVVAELQYYYGTSYVLVRI